jgi:hypothetical protein
MMMQTSQIEGQRKYQSTSALRLQIVEGLAEERLADDGEGEEFYKSL